MYREVKIEANGVLGLECRGKLTKDDFERMHDWLDTELTKYGKRALVIFMGGFEGYDDVSALWADMKMDTRHSGDFSRVAMVADQEWIKWGTKADASYSP